MKIVYTLITAFIFSINYAVSQSMDKGLMAFDAKDYDKALVELKPFAEKSNCLAQYAVGFAFMYGTLKNDSLARVWLEKAAEQKQIKAMGPLAAAYFMATDKDAKVKGYMWGMLAREYDPVQRVTTTTTLIKMYMKPEEVEEANKRIEEYKRRWKDTRNCE